MTNRGSILRLVIIIIAILVLLSFLGVDFQKSVQDPTVQKNYIFVKEKAGPVVGAILKPIVYFWNHVFMDILWPIFIENMKAIRDGKPTDVQNAKGLWTIWNP